MFIGYIKHDRNNIFAKTLQEKLFFMLAISTVTASGFMGLTISSVTKSGDFLPMTNAVVMTRSASLILSLINCCCLTRNYLDTSLAYPPSVLTSSSDSTTRKRPPNDSICSFVRTLHQKLRLQHQAVWR